MTIDASAPQWGNWSGNLVHEPPTNGANYYFRPTNLAELKSVLADAVIKGVTVRVSGQRHSQPPLVTNDNRGAVPPLPTTYLVDMSCYSDLGPDLMDLGPGPNQVTVNPGAKEDDLDTFLTKNNLMLETVTAGGFFSIGGMTAVDVHGGTVEAPIFADTASAFTILGADGNETVLNEQSKDGDGNSLLAFARVSLGALGIVTRITLNVLPRPCANTLRGGSDWYLTTPFPPAGEQQKKANFIATFKDLLKKHTRMECFFTPYAATYAGTSSAFVLWWDVVANPNPCIPNSAVKPKQTACGLSNENQFGAPLIDGIGKYAPYLIRNAQAAYFPGEGAEVITKIALDEIESQGKAANRTYSDLWLVKSSSVIFMSYFIEIPDLQDAGLGITWDGLNVVNTYVTQYGNFHICAPMEFRFVRGGKTAIAGTFSTTPNACFVNLDLIAWVDVGTISQYPDNLLKFFAHVERKWVSLGGLPHNGKMFGFYDPTDEALASYTPPFNKNFLSFITKQRSETRQAPVDAFRKYRQACDPNGLFYTQYLRDLLEG
ncbi:MAG: FAD-binding protein [Silvibacterium sp.]|jgi:FAD/FMN-containing dehydrogenase